ncbi:MAG: uridine kinase [Candidatus Tyloplasma litorale]|nr:MAG: uridine kinase [Mycoplasmatales bacterium]
MKKLILVAGGTASGKTMIAKIISQEYLNRGIKSTLVTMDNYYKSIDQLPENNGLDVNWDDPKTVDWELFISDIKKLMAGKNIVKKTYDFNFYKHIGEKIKYTSNEVIIIEGLFALANKELREISHSKIFIHADDDVRLVRRIRRDSSIRSKQIFELDFFLKRWINDIKPMHNKYIKITNDFADFIIKNNEEFVDKEKERMINLLNSIVVK